MCTYRSLITSNHSRTLKVEQMKQFTIMCRHKRFEVKIGRKNLLKNKALYILAQSQNNGKQTGQQGGK